MWQATSHYLFVREDNISRWYCSVVKFETIQNNANASNGGLTIHTKLIHFVVRKKLYLYFRKYVRTDLEFIKIRVLCHFWFELQTLRRWKVFVPCINFM